LFQLVFSLIFHQIIWFALVTSKKCECYPGKDTDYRFLNHSKFAWRKFLLHFSAANIQKVSVLTSKIRPKVLIIDDSTFRNRSKKRRITCPLFIDHASLKMQFYKGFRMLTLGWSNGHTFMPIDFSLLSSKTSSINGINEVVDKRCSGYKRRMEALQSAPDQIPAMIDRALSKGIEASCVLNGHLVYSTTFDSSYCEQGLDVTEMVKNAKQHYNVNEQMLSLKQLYRSASPLQGKKGLLRSTTTTMAKGVPVKVVYVQNRNKKSEWLAILRTDCTLSEKEIIRIYGIRWDIEVFFKTTKSLLHLQKKFQGCSYDSHTTIVFTRYIVLSWQNRCHTGERTLGGLFYDLCDEVNELDWAVALEQLIELLQDVFKKQIQQLLKNQLSQWIAGLPSYIRAYLPNFWSAKVE
jgi:hypothetical protein